MIAAVGVAFGLLATSTRAADTKAVTATRKAAQRAFKAKRYAAACPLYQKVVDLLPDDPPARADLAFCLQRLGRKAEAVAANYQALALAARTSDGAPNGDAATRRHAYYNLSELGVKVAVPEAECAQLAPAAGCARPLWACRQHGHADGSHGGTIWSILRIGISADHAAIGASEELAPDGLNHYDPQQPTPAADVVLQEAFEARCWPDEDCMDNEQNRCDVIVADGCSGLIGIVCSNSNPVGKADVNVKEANLTPAK
jgi:hypothetical protein